VEDISALYDAFTENLNLDPRPFVIGISMGGIVSWNAVLHGDFVPRAVAGLYPACNLADMYNTGFFTQAIDDDYGFTNPSQFSIATNGYDPTRSENLVPLTKFPIIMWASYGDTTVKKTVNADLLASSVNALGGSVTVITTTGNHGDISNYQPDVLVGFFNSALQATTILKRPPGSETVSPTQSQRGTNYTLTEITEGIRWVPQFSALISTLEGPPTITRGKMGNSSRRTLGQRQ
jgi:pimeloyl-ACP methyl ester carboxylesterase